MVDGVSAESSTAVVGKLEDAESKLEKAGRLAGSSLLDIGAAYPDVPLDIGAAHPDVPLAFRSSRMDRPGLAGSFFEVRHWPASIPHGGCAALKAVAFLY